MNINDLKELLVFIDQKTTLKSNININIDVTEPLKDLYFKIDSVPDTITEKYGNLKGDLKDETTC